MLAPVNDAYCRASQPSEFMKNRSITQIGCWNIRLALALACCFVLLECGLLLMRGLRFHCSTPFGFTLARSASMGADETSPGAVEILQGRAEHRDAVRVAALILLSLSLIAPSRSSPIDKRLQLGSRPGRKGRVQPRGFLARQERTSCITTSKNLCTPCGLTNLIRVSAICFWNNLAAPTANLPLRCSTPSRA